MSKRPVFIIAGDPGGARGILPVINALNVPVAIFAYHQAESILAKNTHPNAQYVSLPQGKPSFEIASECMRAHNPLVLLGATSHNKVNWERYFYQAAKALKIPSYAWVDFWTHYQERFTLNAPLDALADTIFVVDEQARLGMLGCGLEASRVHVVGHPFFDTLRKKKPDDESAQKPSPTKQILFVSQPLRYLRKEGLISLAADYDEQMIFKALFEVTKVLERDTGHSIELHLRRHPRESKEAWLSLITKHSGCMDVSETEAIHDSLLTYDLVVGIHTSLLVEAAILGATVVSIQPLGAQTDPLPTNRTGATKAVYEMSQLLGTIKDALFDQGFRKAQLQHQRKQFSTGNAVNHMLNAMKL